MTTNRTALSLSSKEEQMTLKSAMLALRNSEPNTDDHRLFLKIDDLFWDASGSLAPGSLKSFFNDDEQQKIINAAMGELREHWTGTSQNKLLSKLMVDPNAVAEVPVKPEVREKPPKTRARKP